MIPTGNEETAPAVCFRLVVWDPSNPLTRCTHITPHHKLPDPVFEYCLFFEGWAVWLNQGRVPGSARDRRRTLVVWRILWAVHEVKTCVKGGCRLRSVVLGVKNAGDSLSH